MAPLRQLFLFLALESISTFDWEKLVSASVYVLCRFKYPVIWVVGVVETAAPKSLWENYQEGHFSPWWRVMRPLNLYLRTITVPSLDWVVVTQTSSSPTLRYPMTYHLPKLLLRPVATTQCGHKWIMVISDEKIRQTHHHPPIYTYELLAPSYVSRMPRLTLGKCRTRLSERPVSVEAP